MTVPSGSVTAHMTGNGKANASVGTLLDFTPTIVSIFTANATTFVMVPSVRAVAIGNQSRSQSLHIGERESLNASTRAHLDDAMPNVSITAASLSASGNTTSLSVTVKDNSNMSVDLRHVLIYGNESIFVVPVNSLNTTVHINASDAGTINTSSFTEVGVSGGDNGHHAPSNTPGENASTAGSEHEAVDVGIEAESLHVLNFQIGQG